MGKRIVLGVIVFFLLVLTMVIFKSKWIMENQFLQEKMMMMEKQEMQMAKDGMMKMEGLVGGTWMWEMTVGADKKVVKPKVAEFGVMFAADGKVSVMTDCNDSTGTYTVTGDALSFGEFMGTKKYCEGSQEEAFTKMLMGTEASMMDENGSLMLMTEDGSTVYLNRSAEPTV